MRIGLSSTLRGACGLPELVLDPAPATVRAALLWLGEQVPVLRPRWFAADGHLPERLVVFGNGRPVRFLQGEDYVAPGRGRVGSVPQNRRATRLCSGLSRSGLIANGITALTFGGDKKRRHFAGKRRRSIDAIGDGLRQ